MRPYYDHAGITIYHADCFEILPELRGLDAIVTDCPYSSGGAFRGDRMSSTLEKYASSDSSQQAGIGFTGDNRDQRAFLIWCILWITAARRACNLTATIACFIDWRQLPTMTDAIQGGGFVWRGVGVWSKKFGRPRSGGFSNACEFLPWGSHGELAANEQYPTGAFEHDDAGDAIEPSIEYSPPPVSQRYHLAEKPLAVMEWAMANVRAGALVLDPFIGSGSTLVVAKRRGLRAIGIDVDERQCEIAARRLSQDMLPGLEELEAPDVALTPDVGARLPLPIA